MIPIFRKIRKKMADDNKPIKYMRYALGEIALIIIGILLAVQITDWNQINKNNADELKLLSSFQEEFSQNKEGLIKIKTIYTEIIKSNKNLMKLIGKSPSHINEVNFDSLISVSINIDNYLPSNYVLNNMVSTGKLDFISSEKLRILLYEWNQELQQKDDAYQMLYKYFMESLIPYLTEHASLKNIDLYTENGFISEPSDLSNNSIEMFQNIVFENHLDNYFYPVTLYMESLIRLEDIINKILIETENSKITKD